MKSWKNGFIGVFGILTALCFVAGTVHADTVYVHPTEGAYHTIGDGVGAAAVGDTVLVAPGNYESFTVDKRINIVSEAGPQMTRIVTGGTVTFASTADSSLISGFTISIAGGDGIYVNSGCDYLRIENNIITGCGGDGVHLYCNYPNNLKYVAVVNNTISFNTGNGVYIQHIDGGYGKTSSLTNITVSNNICFRNTGYGIMRAVATSYAKYADNYYLNNDMWENTAGASLDVATEATYGNLFVDPGFLDSEIGNFNLASSSECIDAGRVGANFLDPDGTRNDMGVFGGPGAANWWPYPAGGPVVTEMELTPPSVPVGGTLTLKATGKIR